MTVSASGLAKSYQGAFSLAALGRLMRGGGASGQRTRALEGIDLEVPSGSVAGVLGPNGAGKTTLLRCLLGILRPTSGSVQLFGEDPLRRPGVRARVGALIGHPAFVNYLSGRRNLEIRARFYPGARERVPELLERLGLTEAGEREVRAYSTGMRQRLGIAASLLPDPELWILDEPTSGLDPRGRSEVRELIREVGSAPERTVLVSSHDLHEIEQVCDHVLVLARGKLLVSGSVRSLLDRDQEVVELEVSDPDRARSLLRGLEGCQEVSPGEGPGQLLVTGTRGLAPEIARTLVGAELELRSLTPRSRSLEDFFLETVEEAPCS